MPHLPHVPPRLCCSVCGASDARALVVVPLADDSGAILCGSHALMHSRSEVPPRTLVELKAQLRERRGRRDRRDDGDELGDALSAAFGRGDRGPDRRRTG